MTPFKNLDYIEIILVMNDEEWVLLRDMDRP